MKIGLWIVAILCTASLGAAAAWIVTAPAPGFSKSDPRLAGVGDARRGKDIFDAGDCASCHATPGQPDRLRLGGGLALASPFGTFRPPNISPDPTDGIGGWDVSDLANALVAGVSPQGKHFYPAFPYTSYTGMTVADIKDLFAYLETLAPVAGRAPPHHPKILFAIRRSIGFWKLLFFREGSSNARLTGDAVHDRGGYLVETLSHCAECHSTRNFLGAIKSDQRFAGGPDQQGTGYVPNITPAGIGSWSEADIVKMLATGNTPAHGRVGSSMADVVTNTQSLPEGDRQAIARYIKSLAPKPTPHP
ncbi:alkylated DNA repair protein [Rhizobium vallis]|uniref:Alkylated DNA repair protein n=1 Tax=Rhizobium vallis TaxID=634290 RepID=A0A432PJT7_9HYPH|nr:cytochrome c [Rhizobium vallis]RUM24187.1 alkylated DNA repair protein [Rhizobium vallis]